MPIIKPEIQRALRAAGLSKAESSADVVTILDNNRLSVNDTIEILSEIAYGGDTNQRLRAVDASFKLHGLLKDQSAPIPNISIVIQDQFSPVVEGLNPILIPRPNSTFVETIN